MTITRLIHKRAAAVLLPLAFCIVCRGQNIAPMVQERASTNLHPDAILLQSTEWAIPELIIGGEWTAAIRLTNRGSQAIPTTNGSFIDNTGAPLRSTFQTSSGSIISDIGFSFSLPIGASVEGVFLGSVTAAFGHAIIACSSLGCGTHGIYAEVTLRNHNASRPDFVVVFPIETPVALQYMLFDGRASGNSYITTSLYLVNEALTATTVSIDVVDPNNRLLQTINLPFASLSSQILTLHAIAPETIGIVGKLWLYAAKMRAVQRPSPQPHCVLIHRTASPRFGRGSLDREILRRRFIRHGQTKKITSHQL